MTGYRFKFKKGNKTGEITHNYTSPIYSGIDESLDPIYNNFGNKEAFAPAWDYWNKNIGTGNSGYVEMRVYTVVNGVESLFSYGSMITSKEFREATNLRSFERPADF